MYSHSLSKSLRGPSWQMAVVKTSIKREPPRDSTTSDIGSGLAPVLSSKDGDKPWVKTACIPHETFAYATP